MSYFIYNILQNTHILIHKYICIYLYIRKYTPQSESEHKMIEIETIKVNKTTRDPATSVPVEISSCFYFFILFTTYIHVVFTSLILIAVIDSII